MNTTTLGASNSNFNPSEDCAIDAATAARRQSNIQFMLETLTVDDIPARLDAWLRKFDRAQNIEIKNGALLGLNDMHVIGMSLCSQLHFLNPPAYTNFDIEYVYRQLPRLRVHSCRLQEMSWDCIQDVLTAIQLEIKTFMQQGEKECFAQIDIGEMLICIMCRAGFFIAHKWPCAQSAQKLDYVDVYDDAMHIANHAIAQFLDCLHAIAGVAQMLVRQIYVPSVEHLKQQVEQRKAVAETGETGTDDKQPCRVLSMYEKICSEISEHHREVTLDNFYEQSMVSDLYPGSITQYKHRHQAVFHSISQVVYFNWPAYARKKQSSFAELMQQRQYTNLVPLLCEMYPDIPVLYEHTGALFADCHAQHTLAWVCIAGYWTIVHNVTGCYYNQDPILTLSYALVQQEQHDEHVA